MLKISSSIQGQENSAAADESNIQPYFNDLEVIFSENLPFKFEFRQNDFGQSKANLSIDLNEYIKKYIQYIKDAHDVTKNKDFDDCRAKLLNHLQDFYSPTYLTQLIQLFFSGDKYQIEKVRDTFLFNYSCGFFNEILKNTIDERIQRYFSCKEFLASESGISVVASIDFTIIYDGEDRISFEFLDKYSRGFPSDFLPKINDVEVREEYINRPQNNRHNKRQSCLALAALGILDNLEFNLLKSLLPEFVLPNSLKMQDTINYKDIIFTGLDLELLLAALNKSLDFLSSEKISDIIFKIRKHPNVKEVLFGGEGCGLRQIAAVFFKHADIWSSVGISSIFPETRLRKRRREPKFSEMHISNDIIEGARIRLTTSLESYENTLSNSASVPVSPGVKLSSMSQIFARFGSYSNTDVCLIEDVKSIFTEMPTISLPPLSPSKKF